MNERMEGKKQEQIEKKVNEKYGSAVQKIRKSREDGVLKKLESAWERTGQAVRRTFSNLYDFIYSSWLIVLLILLLGAVLVHLIAMWLIRRRFRNRIRKMLSKARSVRIE